MIKKLIELEWEKGNNNYFKKIGDDIWYYEIEANTFSVEENECGVSEYVCEGNEENLRKIENNEF